jgi:hypothetical protein
MEEEMENYMIERLSELAKLLQIINEKLELLQKSVILSIKINGKIHGVDIGSQFDEIDESSFQKD